MIKGWIPVWVVPLLILFAIGTVWLRLSVVRASYDINQANRDIARVQHEKELLQVKVTGLRSPRKLEVLAKTRFGLSQPRMEQIVHIRKLEKARHGS